MVAMSIAMVVIAALLSSYTFLGRNLVRYSNQQQLEAQSRRALQLLGQDVRMAQDVSCAGTLPYNPNDAGWRTMPTANQVTLYLSVPNGTNPPYNYTVRYTYDANARTLTRTISGTPPPNITSNPLTLLTGVSNFSFNYSDRQHLLATNTLGIKQIEISNFTVSAGTAITGTQSSYTGASARLVLRSKHLVNY
jgi:type II secretory pathway component PulJ